MSETKKQLPQCNQGLGGKQSGAEPKLHPELREHLLYALLQAVLIQKMANPAQLRRLESMEKGWAGIAERTSGDVQMLASYSASLARQYIDSLKMAGNSADEICKALGKMVQ